VRAGAAAIERIARTPSPRVNGMAFIAAYREFRAGPGKVTGLGPLLTAAPVLTWFTVDDSIQAGYI
jgi:hypothetical protein